MNILKVNNLYLFDGEKKVVDNASFEVNSGEIVVVCGGNNSGKSFIAKSLVGDIDNERNNVSKSGEELFLGHKDQLINHAEEIAYIKQKDDWQGRAYNAVLDVVNNISRGNASERKKYILGLFDQFDLNKIKHKKAKALSGGQKKMITIFKGLVKYDARLWIIDEPLNNLDALHAKMFSNFLIQTVKENSNMGILLITHCMMFPRIVKQDGTVIGVSRSYKMDHGTLTETEYISKTCFGAVDENGLYTI